MFLLNEWFIDILRVRCLFVSNVFNEICFVVFRFRVFINFFLIVIEGDNLIVDVCLEKIICWWWCLFWYKDSI